MTQAQILNFELYYSLILLTIKLFRGEMELSEEIEHMLSTHDFVLSISSID
jgi:hypothetical protein